MTKKKDNTTEYEAEVVETAVDVETENDQLNDDDANATTTSNKLPPNVVEVKGRWWIRYLITATVLAVFTVLVAWQQGVFTASDKGELVKYLSNAFSVPGMLAVCFGLLVVASNGGTFDMLAYGLKTLFRLFKKDPLDRKYGGFYEYRKARQEKKRDFWYMVIVGGVYLAVGIALTIWHTVSFQ